MAEKETPMATSQENEVTEEVEEKKELTREVLAEIEI